MRIATWNVNGLRARLEFVQHWLRERQPDVVGIQELKLTDEQFPHVDFEAAGYRALVHGQKSWNGVAVLVRKELPGSDDAEIVQAGLPGQDAFGSRMLDARVAGLRFITLYCPNGKNLAHEDYGRKLEWFDALGDYVDQQSVVAEPSVVCGDFNICPSPLDSWNEQKLIGDIFHTDAERARMARLYEAGLADCYRELHPDTQTFSWWDYRGGAFHRKQGLRIDFLLASAPVVSRLHSVETDREYRKKKDGLTASDHAPVVAELAD